MVANSSQLSPSEVHGHLLQALADLEKAQKNAVLLFDEIVRRKIYKDFGYSSIYQYAELELGFKKTRTAQFLRLAQSLEQLPRLRESLARGEIPWTKAREVATVATPRTESGWITKAREVPSRVLEQEVRATRHRARDAGGPGKTQVTLEMGPGEKSPVAAGKNAASPGLDVLVSASDSVETPRKEKVDPDTPVAVSLRMTAEEYARYRSLLEELGKRGNRTGAVEMVLAGLERLVLAQAPEVGEARRETKDGEGDGEGRVSENPRTMQTDGGKCTGGFPRGNTGSRSPYQVIVHECPTCKRGAVPTDRGEKPLSPRDLRTILCDAHRRSREDKNKAAVPPRLRRAVLARDRYRCRSAGCGRTNFLAVHHLAPREVGGKNKLENLITLCSGCHRALHARE